MSYKENTNYEFVWGIAHDGEEATTETVNDFEVYRRVDDDVYVGEFDRTYEFESEDKLNSYILRIKGQLIRKAKELNADFTYENIWKLWYNTLASIGLVGDSLLEVVVSAITVLCPVQKIKKDNISG